MKRKQRKSLQWRRFGHVILGIIKFGELLLWISVTIINVMLKQKLYQTLEREFHQISNWTLRSWFKKKLACASFFQASSYTCTCLDISWGTYPCVWHERLELKISSKKKQSRRTKQKRKKKSNWIRNGWTTTNWRYLHQPLTQTHTYRFSSTKVNSMK